MFNQNELYVILKLYFFFGRLNNIEQLFQQLDMSLSDFKIINKLGSGAYSSVYKVQRLLDNQIYALKRVNLNGLNEKQKQNSLNEIRILASVRHQNVIGYREAFLDQNTKSLCIVMEFADNGDLYQKIMEKNQKNQNFSQSQVWNLLIQIVRGLKCLHDRKIMHRDLKSANVFLLKDGRAKLGDMNVSKITQKGLCQTQTGTPYYASPEVWKDQSYGPKSDIWSLGCVIYEMITLRPPFQADDMEGLYKKVIKGDYPKLPSRCSSDLIDLIRFMLQTDPHKRPSCQKILGLKMVLKRLNEENKQVEYENPQFLQTIRMPKDIYILTQNLPKPNYFSPKMVHESKNRISSNKTQKYHKKPPLEQKYPKLFPKVNHQKDHSQNKSVLLKNTNIIQAARNQVQLPSKNFVQNNKLIDQIKLRQKKHKRERTNQESMPNLMKQKKTIDMESKIVQIQKIYRENSVFHKK